MPTSIYDDPLPMGVAYMAIPTDRFVISQLDACALSLAERRFDAGNGLGMSPLETGQHNSLSRARPIYGLHTSGGIDRRESIFQRDTCKPKWQPVGNPQQVDVSLKVRSAIIPPDMWDNWRTTIPIQPQKSKPLTGQISRPTQASRLMWCRMTVVLALDVSDADVQRPHDPNTWLCGFQTDIGRSRDRRV